MRFLPCIDSFFFLSSLVSSYFSLIFYSSPPSLGPPSICKDGSQRIGSGAGTATGFSVPRTGSGGIPYPSKAYFFTIHVRYLLGIEFWGAKQSGGEEGRPMRKADSMPNPIYSFSSSVMRAGSEGANGMDIFDISASGAVSKRGDFVCPGLRLIMYVPRNT